MVRTTGRETTEKQMTIKAVLFDFDDTLTLQGAIDFPMLRAALDCPVGTNILEFIDTFPEVNPHHMQSE
jgi:hypothetical protein